MSDKSISELFNLTNWNIPFVFGLDNSSSSNPLPEQGINAFGLGTKNGLLACTLNGHILFRSPSDSSWTYLVRRGNSDSMWEHISYVNEQLTSINNKISSIQTGQAVYSSDLFTNYGTVARFVYYDANTLNTPYKEGFTGLSQGFAFCSGTTSYRTVIAFPMGGNEYYQWYIYRVDNGSIKGWKKITVNG